MRTAVDFIVMLRPPKNTEALIVAVPSGDAVASPNDNLALVVQVQFGDDVAFPTDTSTIAQTEA